MSQPPAVDLATLPEYFAQGDYIQAVLVQLEKDFLTSGLEFTLTAPPPDSFETLIGTFEKVIAHTITRHPENFAQLLYRIDVSPAQIENCARTFPGKTYTQQLAALLLLRELQKIILRKHYRS
jgi:hypothetical protein